VIALMLSLGHGGATGQTNIALDKLVQLQGSDFFYPPGGLVVDPQTVVDGIFLPEYSDWNQGPVWWLDWECRYNMDTCAVEIDLDGAFLIDGFIFQGDSGTMFLLYRDLTNDTWEVAWEIPAAGGFVQTRPNPNDRTEPYLLDEPILTDRLRIIRAVGYPGSDGWEAVSEVQAFGVPADYPELIFSNGFEPVPVLQHFAPVPNLALQ
jgi:hypothetical protein